MYPVRDTKTSGPFEWTTTVPGVNDYLHTSTPTEESIFTLTGVPVNSRYLFFVGPMVLSTEVLVVPPDLGTLPPSTTWVCVLTLLTRLPSVSVLHRNLIS